MSDIDMKAGAGQPSRVATYARRLLLVLLAAGTAALVSSLRASDAQPALRSGEVRLSTGIRMHYAEQGRAGRPAVILLHGYSDSWYSYNPVLPALSSDYHVFALDLRGHGESDRPVSGYSMRELALDVLAFMDARKLTEATVVGHSMGGFVAQQVALAAPERVTRLVLLASATEVRRITGIEELRQAVAALTDPVPESFVREFQVSTAYQPVAAGTMDRIVAESMKLPARVWKALLDGMLATSRADGLRHVHIPTLLLWGEQDAYFPRSEQDALLGLIPGATLKTYPETGHALHWERPELVNRDLLAFLRQSDE